MIRRPVAGLLIDLSGTIHIEDKVIPGAVDAIKHLRAQNIPFLFVTNTTKVTKLLFTLNSKFNSCRFLGVSRQPLPTA